MNVLFLQTSDPIRYRVMLDITSQTVREYVARHGFSYNSFVGVIRGYHPWHATFNRIRMLRGLFASEFVGWVCYMDADAYIADLNFDVRQYLKDKDDVALIAAHAGTDLGWWDINAGVFFMNFAHPVARRIVSDWNSAFDKVTDGQLIQAIQWQNPDDQYLLHQVLQTLPDARQHTLLDVENPRIINYRDARFIRQEIMVNGTLNERIERLRSEVDSALGSFVDPVVTENYAHVDVAAVEEAFVIALYRVFLFRNPDPQGLSDALNEIRGGRSLEDVLRSCVMSPEFNSKHHKFLETYVSS